MSKISYISRGLLVGLCVSLVLVACSSEDKNDGFKKTSTKATTTTQPSATRTIEQPCSLVNLETAATILGTSQEKIKNPESSQDDSGTKRCRYAATSDDGELYLVLNVYVYTTQDAYDLAKKSNSGTDILTSYDEAFTYEKTTQQESERFVAARDGDHRVGVSSSIAVIQPDTQITNEQIVLPTVYALAEQVGLILSKV